MNPSASAYVPSSVIAETLYRRRPTNPTAPPTTANTTSPGSSTTAAAANEVHLTAAERLRNLKNTVAQQPLLKSSISPSTRDAASHAHAASISSSPRVDAHNKDAATTVTHGGFVRYSKHQLLSLRPAAMEFVTRGNIVDHPPFLKIPETFAHLLELPHALEYVNVGAATQMVEHRTYASPLLSSFARTRADVDTTADAEDDIAHARLYKCAICAEGNPQPCPSIQRVIQRASKYAMSTKHGATLMQPPLVVESLLRLALVFEAKQSSMRLRLLAERSPRVVHLVEEYLCGEGYHVPLPPVTAHEEWAAMNAMLRFDAIRDNKTRVITDLSKHWKKRRTQFEQFVHFFAFRDSRPVRPAKNIITQSVKPGMVAMLMGDVTAVLLLHRLGFFIPPDYYWSVYPFLRQALGEGTLVYDVVRHLGLYFSAVQPAEMYNPVERPQRVGQQD